MYCYAVDEGYVNENKLPIVYNKESFVLPTTSASSIVQTTVDAIEDINL